MSGVKIDENKLRSLGISEEVIASMDVRDGGNIDPQGNVLFLDKNRQWSKEHPEKPMRKNRPAGLGIRNAMAKLGSGIAANENSDPAGMFRFFENSAKAPEKSPRYRAVVEEMLGFGSNGYTGGTVLPLDIDLKDKAHNIILPIDLVFDALEKAEYIAILHTCVCRRAYRCKDYHVDLGCIFINAAGRQVVRSGLAREASVEEAKAHVLRAKEDGLFCNAEMVEGEQFIWGLNNNEMNEFRMFCFCCPCCCLAMKVVRYAGETAKERYSSCGYTSTVNHDKCIGCHQCAPACPKQAISYREDGKCRIDQDKCVGCGWCRLECKSDAIRTQQTFPMRSSINEYFLKEHRIDDGITE